MMYIKNNFLKLAGLVTACAIISACDSGFDNPVGDQNFNSGDAEFSNFVSVGDSLTAGYADGALYLSGQENSYPAILAQQFAKVGGGDFNQPLVNDNLGGLIFSGNANPAFGNRLVLNADVALPRPVPEPIEGDPTTEVVGSGLNGMVFNNMGVPGAKSYHIDLDNYGNAAGLGATPPTANPYFVRFVSDSPVSSSSILDNATAQQASFFTMWVGNNDVLSYATNGGDGVIGSGFPPYSAEGNDITDPAVFNVIYPGLVNGMTTANPDAKGVLINIPDVATIPYFTTVPYNAVPFDEEDQATIDALNNAYAPYNAGVTASIGFNGLTAAEAERRQITFALGQNAVVIFDDDLVDLSGVPNTNGALIKMRQATAEDLLVLTTSSKIGTLADPNNPSSAWGLGVPLVDADVLIPSEIEAINDARLAFNATIEATANADPNLIFVDAAALMAGLQSDGFDYGTGYVDSTYATGGAFSLDGVHPTARGYAIVANLIIDAINSGFNANVPKVDPGAYTTIFIK